MTDDVLIDKRVVVIGAGIIGAATAAQLAGKTKSVTLISEGDATSGASGRSLSWLNSLTTESLEYHTLRMEGIKRYRSWSSLRESEQYLRFHGGMYWDGVDGREVELLAGRAARFGYRIELLSPDDAVRAEPTLERRSLPPTGVLFSPDEGWVDLPHLTAALLADFAHAGGELRLNSGPARVVLSGDRVATVVTGSGDEIPVDAVVLAAGAAVPAMVRDLTGFVIPDTTPTAVLIRTEAVNLGLRTVINSPLIAIRPHVDGGLVLDHDWASHRLVQAADGSVSVDAQTVQALLDEASAVLAGRPRLLARTVAIGQKPVPADGLPVVGALADVAGLYVAFSHSGATLGLVLGELIAEEILTASSTPLLANFRPARFDGAAAHSKDHPKA